MRRILRRAVAPAVAGMVVLGLGAGVTAPAPGAAPAATQAASVPAPPPNGTGALQGIASELTDPTGMPAGVVNGPWPPGSVEKPCTPPSAHPYPVVLVHGTFSNANFSWQTLAPMLADAGFCVFSLDYGANQYTAQFGNHSFAVDAVEQSAAELADFVDTVVIPSTGASRVEIVGHSQGGMMPRYFVEHDWDCRASAVHTNAYGEPLCTQTGTDASTGATPGATCAADAPVQGAACVHSLVGLAPSNHGSDAYGLVPLFATLFGQNVYDYPGSQGCPACADQEAGSPFLSALNGAGGSLEATPGVLYYVFETAGDDVVTPAPNPLDESLGVWPSAFLHGPGDQVLNTVLQAQCPTDATDHVGIIYDPVALEDVRNALSNNGVSVGTLPAPSCPPVVLPLVSG